jgi:hypothetical protein
LRTWDCTHADAKHAADWLEALAEVVKQLNAGSLAKMEEAHARLAELEGQ